MYLGSLLIVMITIGSMVGETRSIVVPIYGIRVRVVS